VEDVAFEIDFEAALGGVIGEIGDFGEDFVAERVAEAAADLELGDADIAGAAADGDEMYVLGTGQLGGFVEAAGADGDDGGIFLVGEQAAGHGDGGFDAGGAVGGGGGGDGVLERSLMAGQAAEDARLDASSDDGAQVLFAEAVDYAGGELLGFVEARAA